VFISRIQYILLIPTLFVLMSCTSAKPGATGKSSGAAAQTAASKGAAYELEIAPPDPTRKSTLHVTARGFVLSEAEVTWFVNEGMVLGSGWNQIAASETRRGDTISVQAILRNQKITSNVVRIGNTPPEIVSLRLLPAVFKPGDRLHVEASARDDDDDTVTFRYAWLKNGVAAGDGASLELPFKRGDKISLTVTPFDGQAYGDPSVYEREIQNTPPVIIDHIDFSFDGTTYTYQVKASDQDGDSLTYSLEDPVDAMSIDAASGLLTWVVPDGFKGTKEVTVVANDGHGGVAKYNLSVHI
jgi:hypothetical protein